MMDLQQFYGVDHRQKVSFVMNFHSVSIPAYSLDHLSFGSQFCLYILITWGDFKNTCSYHITIN